MVSHCMLIYSYAFLRYSFIVIRYIFVCRCSRGRRVDAHHPHWQVHRKTAEVAVRVAEPTADVERSRAPAQASIRR